MASYSTPKEIAKRWGVSPAWVSMLCSRGRIPGAYKEGHSWAIPFESSRPEDRRKKIKKPIDASFRFIDLFAGIGGFHQAMRYLGGSCVMAAEINQACVETYKLNFDTEEGGVRGDVNEIDPLSIPPFEVLCAGFPCQPFSKAGYQKGFQDKKRGNLFYTIMDILDAHPEVQFVVLENVRNLADKTENWEIIQSELLKRSFIITEKPLILSPSDFGLPQIRERVYILGVHRNYCTESIREKGYIAFSDLDLAEYRKACKIGDAFSILEEDVSDQYTISEEQSLMLQAWDEFRINTGIKVIGFPIWIHCFGVGTEDTEDLKAQLNYSAMPGWKQRFVDKNRELYLAHKSYIDSWIAKYNMLSRIKLYQKFEWNCGEDVKDIHDGVIQIRQSGIRVKRPTYYPSLVAIVNTPIIWDKRKQVFRHITPREAANLQNFDKRYKFSGTDNQIYQQLGNSVNVRVLKILCKKLFELREQADCS
jgi:DNA (cytosine-5)-methyltransferase 1